MWAASYATPLSDNLTSIKLSPNGKRVYATGYNSDGAVTVAFDAFTGEQKWVTGAAPLRAGAIALAVSADGSRVYISGKSADANGSAIIIGYEAATGAELWTKRSAAMSGASSLSVSPGSDQLYITGSDGMSGSPTASVVVRK